MRAFSYFQVARRAGRRRISAREISERSHFGIDAGGGQSMIVDCRGRLVGKRRDTNGSTVVAGVTNIEALPTVRKT